MGRHAIPTYLTGQELDTSGQYKCPLCTVQTTSDKVDTGWVYCPMLNNHAICLGCCIDYQKVARSEDFDGHPFRDLFDTACQITNRQVSLLRKLCLIHQESIVEEEFKDSTSFDNSYLLQQIRIAKRSLDST